MDSKKKKIALAVSVTAVLGMGICVMPLFGDNFAASRLRATVPNYGVVFNGTNGAASVASLKTNSANAKTGLDNNVKVDYKNVTSVSGKVGRILAKGSYGNSEPINDMTRIQVTSNAAADDAVLMWGATSGYLNHSIDLASVGDGVEVQGANFFKIVATNPVEVESISVEFGCSKKNYGPYALNSSGDPLPSGVKFSSIEGGYSVTKGATGSSVVKSIIPDYYDDGEHGLGPVIEIVDDGSYGIFERNTVIEEIHYPNTIKRASGRWYFGSSTKSKVKEYTLPLNLEYVNKNYLPMGDLEVLNINSRNLNTNGNNCLTESNHPKLKTINVSYDVESLPTIVSSWPKNVTINYEGTEAEWEELKATGNDKWSSFTGNVICSDSVAATVTLSFENATLGDSNGSKVINALVGKTIADPGKPSYNGGSKKFVGWFDAPTDGNQVVFPYTVTDDVTIYAQFEDLPQGASVTDPIMVTLGQSYNYEVFEEANIGYFKVVADHDLTFTAAITSAAASFNDYIYLRGYNNDGTIVKLSTGKSASIDCGNSPSITSSYGVGEILKVRLAAGESFIVGVDGVNSSTTRYGSFTIQFTECVANDGRDYTTAKPFTGTFSETVPENSVLWASYTPETTGDYFITNDCAKWCGAQIGTISNGKFTSTNVNASYRAKSVIMHLEAGTTYYVGFTANAADTVTTFTISSEIAPSYSKGSAKAVPVDGTDEVITHSADFSDRWYKFTLEKAGKVRLTSDKVINDHNQTSKPIFCLYNSSDAIVSFGEGRTSKDKVYDLEAGTYFLKVTTGADTTFNLTPVGEEATVKIYANGPEADATHSEVVDAGISYVLADPTYTSGKYTYYTGFEGWYTDAEFTNPFTSGDAITTNTNIYAKLNGRFQSDLFNKLYNQFGEYINDIFLDGSTHMHFVEDNGEIISTNAGVSSSYSSMAIEFKKAATVSFDYFSTNEGSSWDYFAVYTKPTKTGTQNQALKAAGENMPGYASKTIVVDAGSVIKFEYRKDSRGDKGIDMAKIKNLNITGVKTVTLSYNFNDGATDNQVVEVNANQAITKIADPTRSGYRFDGWYTTIGYDTPFDFSAGIADNTEIYAKWVEQVTVKIYADGPDGDYVTIVLDKGATLTLSNYNNSYYHGHDGWYTDIEFTNPIASGTEVNESMSVYAKHAGKFRNDVANQIDAAYPGMFSNIELNGNSYQMKFDSAAGTFTTGNAGVRGSTCFMTLTLAVDADVSFSYSVSSEAMYDKFTYSVNGSSIINDLSGEVATTAFATTHYAAGTVLKFAYSKDSSGGDEGSDKVVISNLVVVAA